MAYRKALISAGSKQVNHADLPGGDDDLFVNGLPAKTQVGVVIDRSAWCWSEAPANWRAYVRKKSRHLCHRYSIPQKGSAATSD